MMLAKLGKKNYNHGVINKKIQVPGRNLNFKIPRAVPGTIEGLPFQGEGRA
jgi:hypothetical protein